MGQKVHPISLRLGINKTWNSRWYADKKNYSAFVEEDFNLRKFLKASLYSAGVSVIEIERYSKKIRFRIFVARPGIVIGKKGMEIANLKDKLSKKIKDKEVIIDIQEVKKPELDAQLIAENVALQLQRRIAFRKAMKRAVSMAMKFGAQGIKIMCAGRLAGAEMARTEWYKEGRVPLHTLRADIDYGFSESKTTYGIIGVKVSIFKGEVFNKKKDNKK